MPANETLGTISPFMWKLMLDVARDDSLRLDVAQGGYFDGRSSCINLWVGPEDKPEGWPADFKWTSGAFPEPRHYAASFWMEWPEQGEHSWSERTSSFPVVGDVRSPSLADYQAAARRREYRALSEFERLNVTGLRPRPTGRVFGDLAWVKAKFAQIHALTETRMPKLLRLELGGVDGQCFNCRGPLRVILRVLSSPYENGVGNWRHWCPACQALTMPASETVVMLGAGT